ncbi:hypothetical protein C2845_PM12G07340 [Panicum miliaceum]|uniref:Uncharacterized protein n=1 Tax=Panicum miliaceum TaxID=4540 RepID=A0A3L6QFK4_PANMI|nr:hypothetical protein C2845_PM12G07340 [Panicum miliaceum]
MSTYWTSGKRPSQDGYVIIYNGTINDAVHGGPNNDCGNIYSGTICDAIYNGRIDYYFGTIYGGTIHDAVHDGRNDYYFATIYGWDNLRRRRPQWRGCLTFNCTEPASQLCAPCRSVDCCCLGVRRHVLGAMEETGEGGIGPLFAMSLSIRFGTKDESQSQA